MSMGHRSSFYWTSLVTIGYQSNKRIQKVCHGISLGSIGDGKDVSGTSFLILWDIARFYRISI